MDLENFVPKMNKNLPTAYTFLIGDDGAVLIYQNKGNVERRAFCRAVNSPDIKNIRSILNENPLAPIYMLVDVSEQSYIQHSLPAVSSLTVQRLAQKRLEKECASTDLRTFFLLGRAKEGRKDWNFMFVASPFKPPVSDWVDYVCGLPNPLKGLYLLPIELQPMIKKLSKTFAPKNAKDTNWKFFVSYNKVSGLRLVVLHEGKIIFTRSLHLSDTIPDIVAGNIEQETINTVEYLRRLTFQDSDGLEMIFLVSKEIKESLQSSNLKADIVTLLTPYEVASAYKLENAALPTDKYADTVLCSYFLQAGKPVQLVNTPKTQKLTNITEAVKYLAFTCAGCVPIMLAIDGYYGWEIFQRFKEIDNFTKDKNQVDRSWDQVRNKELKWYYEKEKSGEVDRINELVKVYADITVMPEFPLLLVSQFATLKDPNIIVKTLDWHSQKQVGKEKDEISMTLGLEINNNQTNIQKLFTDYDQFVRKVEVTFDNYEVNFTQLFDKITFADKRESIPVKLEIVGPVSEKKKKGKGK
ncbi:MAG: hypothetical protein IPP74_08070 [Alphaproteobacteria bacterium]|nr:hypothetical protein [Alphaproteobacteria bacterium]